jgi:hypothetical protein
MRFCDAVESFRMLIRRAHHIHFQIGVAQLFVKIRRGALRFDGIFGRRCGDACGHAAPTAYFVTF